MVSILIEPYPFNPQGRERLILSAPLNLPDRYQADRDFKRNVDNQHLVYWQNCCLEKVQGKFHLEYVFKVHT